MFFEKIKSEGLSHLSYILGDGGVAAVIDPRRDVRVYLEIARREGARIAYVFETHRNEDYVSGALEISSRTGAEIFHGAALDFKYGNPAGENCTFRMGSLEISVLETPGHTLESISLVARDLETGGGAAGVFTGDALFTGDTGRTDFYPGRHEEMAGLLYDSVAGKLLPLGEGVMIFPAHGGGSVCGAGIASREFSSLGLERANNPALREGRDEFIRRKLSERHYYPPYFRMMEKLNLEGPPVLKNVPLPDVVSPDEFYEMTKKGMAAVDVRSAEAYAGVHVPGSLAIPAGMLSSFGGWLLPHGAAVGIIADNAAESESAARQLFRMGYDGLKAALVDGTRGWESAGMEFGSVQAVHVEELKRRLERQEDFTLLDVRSPEEFEWGGLPGAVNIYAGELPGKVGLVPREKPVTTFCGSGQRAIIAASILKNAGFSEVENCFGSMSACMETSCREIARPG